MVFDIDLASMVQYVVLHYSRIRLIMAFPSIPGPCEDWGESSPHYPYSTYRNPQAASSPGIALFERGARGVVGLLQVATCFPTFNGAWGRGRPTSLYQVVNVRSHTKQ